MKAFATSCHRRGCSHFATAGISQAQQAPKAKGPAAARPRRRRRRRRPRRPKRRLPITACAARLGRAMHQRQPRRAARMCGRANRGPDQNRTVDRAAQHPRARATPARRSPLSNCRSDSTCRPAPSSRSMTARSSDLQIQTCEAARLLCQHADLGGYAGGDEIRQAAESVVPKSCQGDHQHSDAARRFRRGLRQDQVGGARHCEERSDDLSDASAVAMRRIANRRDLMSGERSHGLQLAMPSCA